VCFNPAFAQSGKQATAQEKGELTQLILKDKDVQEVIQQNGASADAVTKGISVKKVDLNKDGQPEYIAVLEEQVMCGAHANCPNWVYRKAGGDYQLLLSTHGQQLLLEKTSTNNFRDLRSEGSDSAFENSVVIYKFDGNKYQAKNCYSRVYAAKGKRAKIVPRKCEESD
jgi:hypothetical protein